MNAVGDPGIGDRDGIELRSEIERSLAAVVPSASPGRGRVLAIGEGLERLARSLPPREVVLLSEFGRPLDSLPGHVRALAWTEPPTLPFAERSFDCVITLDVLGLFPAHARETFVRELCRVAENSVLIACPFAAGDVIAASTRLNRLHRSLFGSDHPRIGRQLELGLPDLDRTRQWLATRFEHVAVARSEPLDRWQISESLALLADEKGDTRGLVHEPFVTPNGGYEASTSSSYRHLLMATRTPLPSVPTLGAPNGDVGADLEAAIGALSYVGIRRCEGLLGEIAERVGRAGTLDADRLIRQLSDDLQESEADREDLRGQNVRLRSELEMLRQQGERGARAEAELADLRTEHHRLAQQTANLQHWVSVIESTRGWKLLEAVRRVRGFILRRPK